MPISKLSDVLSSASSTPALNISRRSALALGALSSAAGLAGYAVGIEPRWVSVEAHEMAVPRLPPHLVGKTAVHLSDTHVGQRVDSDYLRRQFDYVSSLRPDFVFFTGDYVDLATRWHVREGIRLLDHFPRGHFGTALVLGNHDYARRGQTRWAPADQKNTDEVKVLMEALRQADGIDLLVGETTEFNGLQVAGLPDLWRGGFRRGLARRTIAEVSGGAAVVLAHNPDTADLPIWGDFDGWVLSGHTHGGQCTFPIVGAPILPVKNSAYVSGAFDVKDQFRLFINRGLGHTKRVRFMARPEITVFTLAAA